MTPLKTIAFFLGLLTLAGTTGATTSTTTVTSTKHDKTIKNVFCDSFIRDEQHLKTVDKFKFPKCEVYKDNDVGDISWNWNDHYPGSQHTESSGDGDLQQTETSGTLDRGCNSQYLNAATCKIWTAKPLPKDATEKQKENYKNIVGKTPAQICERCTCCEEVPLNINTNSATLAASSLPSTTATATATSIFDD